MTILENQDAVPAVVRLDRQAAMVSSSFDIVVLGQNIVPHLLLLSHPPHQNQNGD
jgi:hypothetical protein